MQRLPRQLRLTRTHHLTRWRLMVTRARMPLLLTWRPRVWMQTGRWQTAICRLRRRLAVKTCRLLMVTVPLATPRQTKARRVRHWRVRHRVMRRRQMKHSLATRHLLPRPPISISRLVMLQVLKKAAKSVLTRAMPKGWMRGVLPAGPRLQPIWSAPFRRSKLPRPNWASLQRLTAARCRRASMMWSCHWQASAPAMRSRRFPTPLQRASKSWSAPSARCRVRLSSG